VADQLTTTAKVKTRLFPAGATDTNDDTLISDLIDQVSAWIQSYTGRKFVAEAAATYTFDTQSGYVLRIPRGIRAITSFGLASLAHQPDSGGTYTTISAANLLLRPLSGDRPEGWPATEVRFSRASSYVFGTIENGATITGDFGWASIPPDIAAVAIDAVVAAYASRKNGASSVLGADDLALPPWSQFFSRGSPQRGTLDRYRHWALG
jgi:hypothetical protein